jgi:hypothetical protein
VFILAAQLIAVQVAFNAILIKVEFRTKELENKFMVTRQLILNKHLRTKEPRLRFKLECVQLETQLHQYWYCLNTPSGS